MTTSVGINIATTAQELSFQNKHEALEQQLANNEISSDYYNKTLQELEAKQNKNNKAIATTAVGLGVTSATTGIGGVIGATVSYHKAMDEEERQELENDKKQSITLFFYSFVLSLICILYKVLKFLPIAKLL